MLQNGSPSGELVSRYSREGDHIVISFRLCRQYPMYMGYDLKVRVRFVDCVFDCDLIRIVKFFVSCVLQIL